MHVKLSSLIPLLGVASGLGYKTHGASRPGHDKPGPDGLGYNTDCGPLDQHMFEALAALGKSPSELRSPGSRPYPHLPAGKSTIPGITHFVYLMMENHSWDHVFGLLNREGQNGLPRDKNGRPDTLVAQKYNNGSIQHLYEMPTTCSGSSNNPSQNWETSHQQFNNGSMDGFAVGGEQDKPLSMGYYTKDHLPVLHSLGETFAINDRYHCGCKGQTWPNRLFALGASARGIVATGQNDDLKKVEYPNGIIVNTLDQYDISWTNYHTPGANSTLSHIFPNITRKLASHHFRSFPEDFLSDARRGKLSQFTFIDYNSSFQSMEPPQNMVEGEKVIYEVVSAIINSPLWHNTVMILNFDEHGGLYDHVPPVAAIAPDNVAPIIPADKQGHNGYYQYDGYGSTGFRVPFLFISPWAKKNYVSHVFHDHGSPLAFMQTLWNIPALSCRDANANNLMDMLDLDALGRRKPNFPDSRSIRLAPPSKNPKYAHCTGENPGVIPARGSVEEPDRHSLGSSSGPDFGPKCIN